MATPNLENEDDNITDCMKIFLPDDEETKTTHRKTQETQHHDLRSIESTLLIRQLPSQGLSFQLWPAATTLLSLLDGYRSNPAASPLATSLSDKSNSPRRLKILELGSGTGLVGIAAAVTLRANVTVTDLPHVIPNLQFNVEANAGVLAAQGGEVHVAALRWGEEGDAAECGKEFDVVMASDVVYYDDLYEPLLKTLRLVMCNGGNRKMVFVMGHLRRWKKDSAFFKRARKFFYVEAIHVDPPFEGSRIGVVVYRFVAKCQKLTAGLGPDV